MGSSLSRASSEAFECFGSRLRQSEGKEPSTLNTQSDREILDYICQQANREITLANDVIDYFRVHREDGIYFRDLRSVIKKSSLYDEYLAMIPKSGDGEGDGEGEEHDSEDLLDPFSTDAMALDLGWTRELATLALEACCNVSTLLEAFTRYRQQKHPKRETQERVIKAIPWQMHPGVTSLWLGDQDEENGN